MAPAARAWRLELWRLHFKFAGPCAQSVLDPVHDPSSHGSIVLIKDIRIPGEHGIQKCATCRLLVGYLLATCWIVVVGRDFFFNENPRVKLRSALRGRAVALYARITSAI